jgi:hypothetical protein
VIGILDWKPQSLVNRRLPLVGGRINQGGCHLPIAAGPLLPLARPMLTHARLGRPVRDWRVLRVLLPLFLLIVGYAIVRAPT